MDQALRRRRLNAPAAISRAGPPLAALLLAAPILLGLLGTALPAFGYLPALGGRALGLRPFAELFASPGLFLSCAISFAAALATPAVALALVMLFLAGWSGTRIFSRIQHIVSPLLAVPHSAAALGFAFLIAPSGLIARALSPWLTGWPRPPDLLIVHDRFGLAMMAGLIVKEIPFLFLIALAALPQTQRERARALTASLGYGRISGFLFGAWPLVYRQIRFGVFAVIAYAGSVVDVAAILGPTTPAPLAPRLLQWMNDPDLTMRLVGSAGALLQLAVVVAALIVWLGVERLARLVAEICCGNGWRLRRDGLLRAVVFAGMAAAAAAVLAGLAALAVWSVAGLWQFPRLLPEALTMRTWTRIAPGILDPLATTLEVGALSTAAAVALAVLCLVDEERTGRRAALSFVYLPLLVPQIAFLFGLQLFFLFAGFGASLAALALAHLVFVLPYVLLSLADPWRAYDGRYEAVAAGLGRSRVSVFFKVRLPMMARALMTAAALGFAVSVAQYLPTVLIGAGRLTTITTEAVALAAGGDRRVVGVYAFLQMLLPMLGFFIATIGAALLSRRRRAMRL